MRSQLFVRGFSSIGVVASGSGDAWIIHCQATKVRTEVHRLIAKNHYPPGLNRKTIDLVLQRSELSSVERIE